jgi:protein associated with RNAse G/E
MPERVVRVEYTKYDGSPHRGYPALHLGEDEHGVWLGVPLHRFDDGDFKYDDPYVLLVPKDSWWTALFNAPSRRTEIYCDVATPAEWSGTGRVRFADLDLDVRRRRGSGAVELVDQDEFEVNRARYGYPTDVVDHAWSAAKWLVNALSSGTEPFAGGYHAWLDQVI